MASPKDRKLTTLEKVVSYPARVGLLGGEALGEAADQALYNAGVRSDKFRESTKQGRGYEKAKQLGRQAVGIDSIDEGLKKGGKVKAKKYARGGGIEQRGKTRGKFR